MVHTASTVNLACGTRVSRSFDAGGRVAPFQMAWRPMKFERMDTLEQSVTGPVKQLGDVVDSESWVRLPQSECQR